MAVWPSGSARSPALVRASATGSSATGCWPMRRDRGRSAGAGGGHTRPRSTSVHLRLRVPDGARSAMSDLAGLDIGWKEETSSSSSTVRELMCESGRRGQKNGRGYYTYDPETRASTPDPEVEQMIRDFGASPRASSSGRSPTRRSWSGCSAADGQRGRQNSRRGHRHPRPATSMWCGSTATAGRSTAVVRCTGPTRWAWPRSPRRSRGTPHRSAGATGRSHRCWQRLADEGGQLQTYTN